MNYQINSSLVLWIPTVPGTKTCNGHLKSISLPLCWHNCSIFSLHLIFSLGLNPTNTYVHITSTGSAWRGQMNAPTLIQQNELTDLCRWSQTASEISTNAEVFKMQLFTVSIVKMAPNYSSLLTVRLSYVTHLRGSNEALSLLIPPSSAETTILKRQGRYLSPHTF